MLAPPYHGNEIADRLRRNCFYKLLTGPAGQQVGTGPISFPNQIGQAQFELGIIAGDRSLNPWFSACIEGPDDGKVSVQSTKIDGMRGFIIVHHTHSCMMWRKD